MEEGADANDLAKFSKPMNLPSGVSMLPLPSQQIEPTNKDQVEAAPKDPKVPKSAKVEKRKIEKGQPMPVQFQWGAPRVMVSFIKGSSVELGIL